MARSPPRGLVARHLLKNYESRIVPQSFWGDDEEDSPSPTIPNSTNPLVMEPTSLLNFEKRRAD